MEIVGKFGLLSGSQSACREMYNPSINQRFWTQSRRRDHPFCKLKADSKAQKRSASKKSRTDRGVQVDAAEGAAEQQAGIHAVIRTPDAHAVVCAHCAHGVLPGRLPPLGCEVEHLPQ